MLIDGNDERGIDVAVMTRAGFSIDSICSNVDRTDEVGTVFSRDCPQYEVRTPSGAMVHVLVNHFKSQSGGGVPQQTSLACRRIAVHNQMLTSIGDGAQAATLRASVEVSRENLESAGDDPRAAGAGASGTGEADHPDRSAACTVARSCSVRTCARPSLAASELADRRAPQPLHGIWSATSWLGN
jgi:hypothetical protein